MVVQAHPGTRSSFSARSFPANNVFQKVVLMLVKNIVLLLQRPMSKMASTGIEPATLAVLAPRSNPLSYPATVEKSSLSLQQPCPQGLSRSPCSSRRATPFLDSTRPLNNEMTSSSLIYWRVSPPVTLETGIQFPDGEAVLNLLYCFGPGLSRRKAKRRAICIGRELNRTLNHQCAPRIETNGRKR